MKRYLFCAVLFISLVAFGVNAFAATSFERADSYDSFYSQDGTGWDETYLLDSTPPSQPPPSLSEDVHAIRQYIEFGLFALLPLIIGIVIVVWGCRWFQSTFIPE